MPRSFVPGEARRYGADPGPDPGIRSSRRRLLTSFGMECSSCGHTNREGAKYCDNCGHALVDGAGREAPEGERKQVTVLFADLMGSMGLAEQTDPEEWRRIMDRFF